MVTTDSAYPSHALDRPHGPLLRAACLLLLAWAALPAAAQTESAGMSIVLTPERVVEGNIASITVTLGEARTDDLIVYVTFEPVAPTLASDYRMYWFGTFGSLTLSEEVEFPITAGTTTSRIGQLSTYPDDVFVGDRTIRISARTENNVLSPVQATLTIEEDDEASAGICDRTDQVERALIDALGGVACSQVTDEQLATITDLSLSGLDLKSLAPGDFDGLSNVTSLSISDTYLGELKRRTFFGLSNLSTLTLRNNRLTSLSPGSFAGMPELRTLRIQSHTAQAITYLDADTFTGLPELEKLVISDAGVSFLRAHAFRGLPKLQHLDLSYSGPLEELSVDAFAGLSALRYLNLRRVESLGSLGLSYNTPAVPLPEGIFDDLTSLTDLDLRVRAWWAGMLPSGLLEHSNNLRYLMLGNTRAVSRFPDRMFANLTGPLEFLDAWRGTFLVTLEDLGNGQVRAVVPSGAPSNVVVPLVVTGGSVVGGALTVTISAGAIESETVQVRRTAGSATVTVDIGELPSVPEYRTGSSYNQVTSPFGISWASTGHWGYRFAKGAELPLTLESTVTLESADEELRENGGSTTLTARLSDDAQGAAEELRFDVTVEADAPATVGDVNVQGELTIAAGRSAGTVTIRAADNNRYTGDRTVRVSAAPRDQVTVAVANQVKLTIRDNEPVPAARLALSPETIGEGNAASVTAMLVGAPPGVPVTLAVTTTVESGAVTFTQSGATLTIAAGANQSSGTLTIGTTHNPTYASDGSLRVAATIAGLSGLTPPPPRILTVSEVDGPPTAKLVASSASIEEGTNGQSHITARLSHRSAATIILQVASAAEAPATAADFTQSGEFLTIAAGQTQSTGRVTISANNDDRYAGNRTVAITATVFAGNAVPGTATITINEDDSVPPVAVRLSRGKIAEAEGTAGTATVTAEMDAAAATEVTLSVTVETLFPTVASEFELNGHALTIAVGDTASTGTVTVSSVDDNHYIGTKYVRVSAVVAGAVDATSSAPVTLTIEEDEARPTLSLAVSPDSIREDGKVATVTATLQPPYRELLTGVVTAMPVAPATDADYSLSTNRALTFAAGSAENSGEVTITSVQDEFSSPPRTIHIRGQVTGRLSFAASAVALTITDLEPQPTVTLVLSTDRLLEEGGFTDGFAGVTATLDAGLAHDTTLSVTVAPEEEETAAHAADFVIHGTELRIPMGATKSPYPVYIGAASDSVHEPVTTFTVGAEVTAGYAAAPAAVTLTIVDDDDPPVVALQLSKTRIDEGDDTVPVTVTARMRQGLSSAATTIEVGVDPPADDHETDYVLSANRMLTIAARTADSSGTVTIAPEDDSNYAPDRTLTVTGTADNAVGVTGPAARILEIEDDDRDSTITLSLSQGSIAEQGGTALVSAAASVAYGVPVTLTVTATAEAGRADEFSQSGSTLTFAAGETQSTGAVRITAVDNAYDAPDHFVRITATASGSELDLAAPAALRLTIADDEGTPAVTLRLSPRRIDEAGGEATLSAAIDPPSFAATAVRLSVAAVEPAEADDVEVPTTLIIAAQAAASEEFTLTAVDNEVYTGDKTVHLHGEAANVYGVTDPAAVKLTIAESDPLPPLTLRLSHTDLAEQDGTTTVTAELDRAVTEELMLTVTAAAVAPAVAAEFTQEGTTLTIAAGDTASSGEVTVSGVDDDHYVGVKQVLVSATVTGSDDISAPASVTLTIGEDEDEPALSLAVSPESIREDQVAAVTATLEPAYRDQLTVTVTATPVEPATGDDYVLSPNALTFAGGSTASSTVTVTAVPDDLASPPTTVRLDAESTETLLVAAEPVTLTITDVQERPTVSLVLSAEEIAEADGVANVTAALDVGSVLATTLSVTVQAVAPALAGDFRQHGVELTVPAGQTASIGAVTVTAVPDDVDAADGTYTVGAVLTAGYAAAPADLTLTIADDDETPPRVELLLDPAEIEEGAGSVTVTARLSGGRSGEVTTVAVEVEPDETEGGYQLGDDVTLTIAARERESVGTVTVTPDDDGFYGPNRTLTVSGTATNGHGVTGPADRTLEVTEDEAQPVITLALSADTIRERGGSALVSARAGFGFGVRVTLTVTAEGEAERADEFALSGSTLTFAPRATRSYGSVRVTAVDNAYHAPDHVVLITAAPEAVGVELDLAAPAARALTIADDEGTPAVTLRLSPRRIDEAGGEATLSAAIDPPSFAATAVRLSVAAVEPAEADDVEVPTTLIIAAQAAASEEFTLTAVDNEVYTGDKTVHLHGEAANVYGVTAPATVELTIAESDPLPPLTLRLSHTDLAEQDGTTTVTAELDRAVTEELMLTVTAAAVAPAVAAEFTQEGTTLTIAAGDTASSGEVTVSGVDDDHYVGVKQVLVSATVDRVGRHQRAGAGDADDRGGRG